MDKTKLIERTQALLRQREQDLKETLAEIAYLEEVAARTENKELATKIAAAIAGARTRRDRQQNNVKASQGLIQALQAEPRSKK